MPVPDFSPGEVLTAAAMDSISGWLVKTVTIGAGVSSVPVADCFSADFENYRIIISGVDLSVADDYIYITFPTSSGNVYYGSIGWRTWANVVSGSGLNGSNLGIRIGLGNTNDSTSFQLDVFNPFVSNRYTAVTFTNISTNLASNGGGIHEQNASQTGFNIVSQTGTTMTGGTIRVYGYRN